MSNRLLSPTQVVLATLGVALTLLLSALDQTVVGVAMPRIVGEMHGLEFYAWVTTAYLVASTAMLPVAGMLGDMFGRKPFLLGCIGAAMLIAGLTPLLVALTLTRDHAWLSSQVLGLLVLAALLLAGFGWVERRVAHPVVPFALFRRNVFAVPAVIAFFSAIGMF